MPSAPRKLPSSLSCPPLPAHSIFWEYSFETKEPGRSFSKENSDWRKGKLWPAWVAYSRSFGVEGDGEEGGSWVGLTFDENKYPQLPERPEDADLPSIKDMIRAFVKAVYRNYSSSYN
jgi:hypothetical protein